MQIRVSSVSVNATAFTFAIMYGLLGCIMGAIMIPVSLFSGHAMQALLGLVFPIFYFLGGYLSAAIGALLYNLIAPRTGGVKFAFEAIGSALQPTAENP
jgi:hypothetical protein